MKTADVIRRAGRSLRHAKVRTILTALAIGVGAFTLTATLAASTGAKAFIESVINSNFDPAELIVTNDEQVLGNGDTSKPREYDPSFGAGSSSAGALTQIERLTQEDITILRNTKGVESVREGISVNVAYITRQGQEKYVATVQAFNPYQQPELLAGNIESGVEDNEVLLPEGFLKALGFSNAKQAIGTDLTFAIQKSVSPQSIAAQIAKGVSPEQIAQSSSDLLVKETFTITAVLKKAVTQQPGTELNVYVNNDEALILNDIKTKGTDDFQKYPSVFVKVEGGEDKQKLEAVQKRLEEKGYTTLSVEETQAFLLQFISILQGIVAGFAFLAVIASVFGVINTQYISVLERTQQIGLMKALGTRRRDIARLFRFEAAWIGLLGGALGAGLAFVLGTLLNPWITKTIELGEANSLLIFEPLPIAGVVFGLMFVAIFAGILPARKAGKLDPVEALRTE